ncbi:MAG: S8 family serine peptidase [Solirubrobacteraceae bacterium]
MRRRRVVLGGVVALLFAGAGMPARASDFEHPASQDSAQQFAPLSPQRQDTPNDPVYDQAEPDTQQPAGARSTNVFDERFDLFGFPSQLTKGAIYAVGPNAGKQQVSGFNAAGAWKLTRGRPDVTIAILDTGIKWNKTELRTQIHLNTGELPHPQHDRSLSLEPGGPPCGTYVSGSYDANGDGAVNVVDYACDSRVSVSWPGRAGPAGLVTGQDLIHAFGGCQVTNHQLGACGGHYDNDGNGYANDIAGWNFFDDNNDPGDLSSYFAAANHGSGRADDAAERGNDGSGSIGVCPRCQIMPIRVWDTFVADGNNFGLGMSYASDNGVQVIEGADGSLYHSAFAEAASQHAYDQGSVQTYSGDDLNTGNHNYPANYGHAMLVQGTVPDTVGLGTAIPSPPAGTPANIVQALSTLQGVVSSLGVGSSVPVSTYFRGANTTQFGGKSSISMEGPTGSSNTGKASGAAGLLVSAALDKGITLRPDETRAILEQTSERALTGNLGAVGIPDPGADPTLPADQQWTSHFGWGRVNLGAAVAVAQSGKIPPQAAINSPDWYAPVTGNSLQINGLAQARFATGKSFHWKLLWGPGLAPSTANQLQVVREGDSTSSVSDFGAIDLNAVRAAMANYTPPPDTGGPIFTPGGTSPYQGQFTVQLEVSGAGIPTTGIDRRVFTALNDPTLRSGYPKRLGTGGEAPIRYADINGDNVQELIVPTEDGKVHAYEPDGSELPGWPVQTQVQSSAAQHLSSPVFAGGVPPPREPPRAPTIVDLAGDGQPDVITAAGNHIYAWHADGSPVAGFPVSGDPSFCGPALESQALGQRPKCGFLASPAIARLEGAAAGPDIVEPGLDGHLYAFRADGTPVPHFPVLLQDPAPGNTQIAESINDPAIVDLNGDGRDDVVVATNEEYGSSGNTNDLNVAASLIGGATRVYAVNGATGKYLPGWPIAQPGIIQNVLPLVGPGNDPAVAKIGGSEQVISSSTGGSLIESAPNGSTTRTLQQNAYGPGSNAVDRVGSLNLFEGSSVGDLLGIGMPAVVKYQTTLSAAADLLLVGQNVPYNHLIGALDAATGAPLPSWPRITDDYQFLSSSTIAKMSSAGLPANQVLAGTGLGLLHAYDGASGADLASFPKVTGGWLFAPAAISSDGRLADITREGFLFEWKSSQPACQSEWPSFRHDQQGSGNYNRDGTPPAAPASGTLASSGASAYLLSFTAPGDDGFCGTAASYVTRIDGVLRDLGTGPPGPGGSTFSKNLSLPAGARKLSVQARDAAGNLGQAATFDVPAAGETNTGGGSPTGLPSGSGGSGAGDGGSGGSLLPPTGNGARACVAGAPRSGFVRSGRHGRQLRLRGHALDRSCGRSAIRRVRVAVALLLRGGRCRFLLPGGRFTAPGSCRRVRTLPARLRKAAPGRKATWAISVGRPVPSGTYRASVYAADAAGRQERRGRHDTVRLRVR